jgi:hypothetical protein
VESWLEIHARALEAAADPTWDLVFIHYPLPHGPSIAPALGRPLLPGRAQAGYVANALLADEALGELERRVEAAGLGTRTAWVVLGDHGLRTRSLDSLPSPALAPGERRPVPLLVRIPGGGAGVRDATPVPTTVLPALVAELLDGTLARHGELPGWLAAHGRAAEGRAR